MKKAQATKLTDSRESILPRFLNGEDVPPLALDAFACDPAALATLRTSLAATAAKKVGGMGKHYDGTFERDGTTLRYELKHCEKKISPEHLTWCPWEGAVQFVQSQYKSKEAKKFLDADGLYSSWFTDYVMPFLTKHSLPAMTLADYQKASSSMDAHKKGTSPAADFLRLLRSTPALQAELQAQWLRFEETWMPANLLNHEAFFLFIKKVLEEKDVWLNINKSGAFAIEGFLVNGLRYDGVSKKPHGGIVFNYTMRLQKKSCSAGEERESKIQFKFTWKNGGQAIQNLNFLVVSG
jgi:hypothetical protein